MRLINADELIYMEYGGIRFVPTEFIEEAPTIDAVPVVHGHWDWRDVSHIGFYTKVCSRCGFKHEHNTHYLYCPNCGAKMDEEDQKMPDVEKYIELMKDAVETSRENEEIGHDMADGILCDFLTELGYEDLVKEWDNVKKWYA